jgi:signal transduction histidine kinase
MTDHTARILIVDDNEINRDVLEGLVEALGHQSILAKSGKEALDLIRAQPQPDLVLLDILMPELGGYEVLRYIKQDENLRSTPVIMISVIDELESVIQCIEAGADDYLTKPFNALLLKARINACLERKRYHDQEKKFNLWLATSYQKLQKAEEARDSLLHMIVHDMNNPLAYILGQSEMLMITKGNDNGKLAQSISNIHRAANQINALVACILDTAKMETSQIQVHPINIDVGFLCREIAEQFTPNLSEKKCTLHLQIENDVHCHADKGLLTRILYNLMANAVKYGLTATKPDIVLSASVDNNRIHISVADNGPGIPEEHLKKVFTKFYQIEHSTKGVGLGLTFCEMATQAMGGQITVENNPQGGCSFCVDIPEKTDSE